MSVGPDPMRDAALSRLHAIARAERARSRGEDRLDGAIADFFLDTPARLDDRARALIAQWLRGVVGGIETDIRRHAARLLVAAGETARAEAMLTQGGAMLRLTRAGLLRDRDLMGELIARVRHDLIAQALPSAISGPDAASLLVRLAAVPDTIVATAATALLVADSRRRTANETGAGSRSELPAELHHRLVWWVAAAIREGLHDLMKDAGVPSVTGGVVQSDRAITDAALRCLAAHDEGERLEAVAARLALAIDARPDELPALLVEALGDRRLALFIAVLASATGMDFDQARAIVVDPEGDQLWLALRANNLDRETIARIGLALSEADPRRDIESFAEALDGIMAVTEADARAAIAPLSLHRDFRVALRALTRSDR